LTRQQHSLVLRIDPFSTSILYLFITYPLRNLVTGSNR
jgi:hypothetical protein